MYEEISNPNISYIAEYLHIAHLLSKDGKNQFLSSKPNNLTNNIGEYLISLGIEKERIVYNYGVTKGSIRIPIAVLSTDLTKALFGIWVEQDIIGKKFTDINIKYYNILKDNGWTFYNLYAHNWYYNNQVEKDKLKEFIMNAGK